MILSRRKSWKVVFKENTLVVGKTRGETSNLDESSCRSLIFFFRVNNNATILPKPVITGFTLLPQ